MNIFKLSAIAAVFLSFQSPDTYEWLEEMDSPATLEWVAKQNATTDTYFSDQKRLNQFKKRITEIADIESVGLPLEKGGYKFFFSQEKGQDQYQLKMEAPNGAQKTIFDPNTSPHTSIVGMQLSKDGSLLSYGLSHSGGDESSWHFLQVPSLTPFDDCLEHLKFSAPVWAKNGKGVYYSRFCTQKNIGIFYHRLGTDQKNDPMIFSSDLITSPVTTVLDGEYLLLQQNKGCDNRVGIILLNLTTHKTTSIYPQGASSCSFIKEIEGKIYFKTEDSIIAISPWTKGIEEIVPASENVLFDAAMTQDTIVCSYLENCKSTVKVFDLNGNFSHIVPLPLCTATLSSSDDLVYIQSVNFVTPSTLYCHNPKTKTTDPYFVPECDWNPEDYTTTQVFYPSKDGTAIPLFITHKKGLKPTTDTPTLLYGYGGFGIPMTPRFNPLNLAWIENGGIYAYASLRGGGEYGPSWHEEGRLRNKQNVFDDFIAAAEYLIEKGYTNHKKLAITGRSNGGLLVGACLTQRPDLFGAAIPQVGVYDMLKFHQFTIGWAWMSDYGNPEIPEDRANLLSYSPYHNILPDTTYPPTFITTADHDDRVVPLHSFKFAAKLQDAQAGPSLILLRAYTNSGHGAGRSLSGQVTEYAEMLYFLEKELSN